MWLRYRPVREIHDELTPVGLRELPSRWLSEKCSGCRKCGSFYRSPGEMNKSFTSLMHFYTAAHLHKLGVEKSRYMFISTVESTYFINCLNDVAHNTGRISELISPRKFVTKSRQNFQAYPQYEYNYAVEDGHTGDHKQQSEVRHGDVVKGEYSFLEPDGTHRIVYYEADDKNGFNAKVIRKGPAQHPQHYAIAAEEYKGGH